MEAIQTQTQKRFSDMRLILEISAAISSPNKDVLHGASVILPKSRYIKLNSPNESILNLNLSVWRF